MTPTPRLLFSELTGTVYLVTRYTVKPHPTKPGRELIIAHRKVDVTEDFDAISPQRRRHAARKRREADKAGCKTEGNGGTPTGGTRP